MWHWRASCMHAKTVEARSGALRPSRHTQPITETVPPSLWSFTSGLDRDQGCHKTRVRVVLCELMCPRCGIDAYINMHTKPVEHQSGALRPKGHTQSEHRNGTSLPVGPSSHFSITVIVVPNQIPCGALKCLKCGIGASDSMHTKPVEPPSGTLRPSRHTQPSTETVLPLCGPSRQDSIEVKVVPKPDSVWCCVS